MIMITSNEPWNTETHKTDRNPPITDHKPWLFEPVKVEFCFLRGPLRWLTAAENVIVSWLLNFRIRMFVNSAEKGITIGQTVLKFIFVVSVTSDMFLVEIFIWHEVFTINFSSSIANMDCSLAEGQPHGLQITASNKWSAHAQCCPICLAANN